MEYCSQKGESKNGRFETKLWLGKFQKIFFLISQLNNSKFIKLYVKHIKNIVIFSAEEGRIIKFNSSDCPCGKSQDVHNISAMKDQLSNFLDKWENVHEKFSLPTGSSELTTSKVSR